MVHPELSHKKETVYEGTYQVDENSFAKQELEELDFQKLLILRKAKRKYRIWAKGRPREEI